MREYSPKTKTNTEKQAEKLYRRRAILANSAILGAMAGKFPAARRMHDRLTGELSQLQGATSEEFEAERARKSDNKW